MRLLGLDVGTKTIGVAVSDEGGVVATPLKTLSRHGGKRDVAAVRALMDETGATALIVGLPWSCRAARETPRAARVSWAGSWPNSSAARSITGMNASPPQRPSAC